MIACVSGKSQKRRALKDKNYLEFEKLRPDFPSFSLDSMIAKGDDREDTVYILNDGQFMRYDVFSDSLSVLMDTLSKLNNSVPYYGYRIVLYNGADRKQAIFERGKALKLLSGSNTKIYMKYQQPYFKVKVGNFYNRITAYPSYKRLKKHFPTALLVPEIIDMRNIQYGE